MMQTARPGHRACLNQHPEEYDLRIVAVRCRHLSPPRIALLSANGTVTFHRQGSLRLLKDNMGWLRSFTYTKHTALAAGSLGFPVKSSFRRRNDMMDIHHLPCPSQNDLWTPASHSRARLSAAASVPVVGPQLLALFRVLRIKRQRSEIRCSTLEITVVPSPMLNLSSRNFDQNQVVAKDP